MLKMAQVNIYLCFSLVLKKGNVTNQREHLILLLANMDIRKKNLQTYAHVSMPFVLHGISIDKKENTCILISPPLLGGLPSFPNFYFFHLIHYWYWWKIHCSWMARPFSNWWKRFLRIISHGVNIYTLNNNWSKLTALWLRLLPKSPH